MNRIPLSLTVLGTLLGIAVQTAPADAQATRTWVSGVGNDANPCSRTAPCRTFAGAIPRTLAGGEINCLDPGGFGAVTITISIAISCETEGGVLNAGTAGIVINTLATDKVFLNGLHINGGGTGTHGIRFLRAGALHVRNSTIRGATGNGIDFAPNGAGELFVTDTYIAETGGAATTAGISIVPTGTGSARFLIDNSHLDNNVNGLRASGVGSTGGIRGIVRNSTASGNGGNGIATTSPGGAVISLFLERNAVGNNLNGIVSDGNQSFVNISGNVVTANGTGIVTSNGGAINSYTNNFIDGNTTVNGAPTGSLTPQ